MAPDNQRILKIGGEWNFSFKYDFDRHSPANVSWGPMGSYLKLNDGQTVDVISEPIKFPYSQVTSKKKLLAEEPELRLIPHPLCWEKKSGTCSLSCGINLISKLRKIEKKVINSYRSLTDRMGFSSMLNDQGVKVFFENHNPTTPNRQGPDIGIQYRSAIFCHNPEQEQAAKDVVAMVKESS